MSTHRVRRPVIAGNWKMNLGPDATTSFFTDFLRRHDARDDRTVVFFPPALSFAAAARAVEGRADIGLGVQNIHWEKSGAFTGEISAAMAAEAGAKFGLTGHSERRHVFGETDDEVGRKTAAALAAGLVPVACVGEKLDEREAGQLRAVLLRQLDAILAVLPDGAGESLVIAYEPVWAIGTGKVATTEQAQEVHAFIRGLLTKLFTEPVAQKVRLLYGGSMKPSNAPELLAQKDIDGGLIGGAALEARSFVELVTAAAAAK
jgi:triosephosphate isomerase (TIM)